MPWAAADVLYELPDDEKLIVYPGMPYLPVCVPVLSNDENEVAVQDSEIGPPVPQWRKSGLFSALVSIDRVAALGLAPPTK